MHQVHGLPGRACFGSITHAVHPSMVMRWRAYPCQLSTLSPGQDSAAGAVTAGAAGLASSAFAGMA